MRDAFAAFKPRRLRRSHRGLAPRSLWHAYLGSLDGAVYIGRQAILEMWKELDEALGGSLRPEPLDYVDCGGRIVVVIEARGTGAASRAEVSQRWAQLALVRDGLGRSSPAVESRQAALAAAGGP